MEIKHIFWSCCKVEIGNGDKTSFWEDHWTANASLASMFPRLFSISTNKEITVREVLEQGIVSLHFRRAMVGELHTQWVQLVQMLDGMTLRDEPDKLRWTLTSSGNFSVKSFYLAMQLSNTVPYKFLWKVKIPLRVKTFLWLVLKKSILTRDVLLKRGGKCEPKCLFCGKNESIAHLFFLCSLARYVWNVVSSAFGFNCHFNTVDQCISSWLRGYGKKKRNLITVGIAAVIWSLWKARNLACFQYKWPDEPCTVICKICSYIQQWSSLQVTQDGRDRLTFCAKVLEKVAMEVYGARRSWASWIPRLE